MPVQVRFTLDTAGIGQYLRTNRDLRAALAEVVARGVTYAKSIAPVGRAGEGGAYLRGRHPGLYRDGIQGEVRLTGDRIIGRVVATDQKSWWIEWGSQHMPKYRVLGRTLDHLTSGGGS